MRFGLTFYREVGGVGWREKRALRVGTVDGFVRILRSGVGCFHFSPGFLLICRLIHGLCPPYAPGFSIFSASRFRFHR